MTTRPPAPLARPLACGFLALLLLGSPACTRHNPAAVLDGGRDDGSAAFDLVASAEETPDQYSFFCEVMPGTDAPTGGAINIYFKGDLSQTTYSDGCSGQTPTGYSIAISRYHLLRSASDSSPALCFDHGSKASVADLYTDNLIGSCRTKDIPTASYTHGRTKVDWVRYTVSGAYHTLMQHHNGKFTIFRAFSDVVYGGKSYKAGTGMITFTGTSTFNFSVTYKPLPSIPGATYETKNGEFLTTFAFSKPLSIIQSNTQTHWARFNQKIYESFRWTELLGLGYKSGVWDLSVVPGMTEPVKLFGASGYYVTSSLD